MDDESVKENVEDNPENNAVPPQTKHNAVGKKPQETEDSSSPHPDKESTETRGLDITEEQVAEVQIAEAEDINAGYIEDKDKPEVEIFTKFLIFQIAYLHIYSCTDL